MLYDYTGYDPVYSRYSPGTVLQFKTIETAFSNDRIEDDLIFTADGVFRKRTFRMLKLP